ncbi:MAG: ABC transporter permease subunit [Vicinamibacteria bacterium]|nr:ABC transporter permease subunit [Vicinamibacteria bacterium]
MPIYDQRYRRYEARNPLRELRFWPITREALKLVIARRAFLLLLLVAWVPFIARTIQVYVVTRFPEAGRVLPVDGRLFGEFLSGQLGFALLVSVFGGAGLIANDLRTGAILVYLSRPLTRADYILGKLSALLSLNLFVTLAPALMLWIVAVSLAPEQFATLKLLWLPPAIVLHALVIGLAMGLMALAVSSLSKSARVAGLAFAGLFIGLEIARGVLRGMFRTPETGLVSLQGNLHALGNALFGIQHRFFNQPWPLAALALLVMAALSLWVLRARVRAVEVVQ